MSKRPTALPALGLIFVFVIIACNSAHKPTPANFTKALNAYLAEHNDCLLPQIQHFPYETSDLAETKQLDSLLANQLLTASREPAIHASRYTPTDAGARYASHFCYGHRQVTTIDTFTPPAKGASGFPETQVTYHYTMLDVPVWAKSANIQAAFPKLAEQLSGSPTATTTLAQSAVDWQVPN